MRKCALKWLINFIIFANDNDVVVLVVIYMFDYTAIYCLSVFNYFQ
jgi:hypothetical protein